MKDIYEDARVAAAALYRLAQAAGLLRIFRQECGHHPATQHELRAWLAERREKITPITPTEDDYNQAEQSNPELVKRARLLDTLN